MAVVQNVGEEQGFRRFVVCRKIGSNPGDAMRILVALQKADKHTLPTQVATCDGVSR